MRVAMIAAWIAFVLMAGAVGYGFVYGRGWSEVEQIWALPWGKVSFADVYLGFTFFSVWVIHRERSIALAIVWIALLLVLGNVISALYVAIALTRAGGQWSRFWNGQT